jgi:hypothetical protein
MRRRRWFRLPSAEKTANSPTISPGRRRARPRLDEGCRPDPRREDDLPLGEGALLPANGTGAGFSLFSIHGAALVEVAHSAGTMSGRPNVRPPTRLSLVSRISSQSLPRLPLRNQLQAGPAGWDQGAIDGRLVGVRNDRLAGWTESEERVRIVLDRDEVDGIR